MKNLLVAAGLVVFACVVGSTEKGRLDLRFATHTNNWEVHDRLLARIGCLRLTDLDAELRPLPESALRPRCTPDLAAAPSWVLLDHEDRVLLRCRDRGMSRRETAAHLGVPAGHVGRRFRNLQRRLQECLK